MASSTTGINQNEYLHVQKANIFIVITLQKPHAQLNQNVYIKSDKLKLIKQKMGDRLELIDTEDSLNINNSFSTFLCSSVLPENENKYFSNNNIKYNAHG